MVFYSRLRTHNSVKAAPDVGLQRLAAAKGLAVLGTNA